MGFDLRKLLGIDLPILQAPMAGAQGSAMAAAVTGAGGLGALPCGMLSVEELRAEVDAIRRATPGPFNLNFFCHVAPTPDPARDAAWRRTLAPYYAELGVDPASVTAGPTRAPFSDDFAEAVADLAPAVVSFHFGLPAPDLLARVNATGAKVLSSATTVDEALWLERRGVDAIIAQGSEAGGHRAMFLTDDLTTQVGTFALVPQLVKAVRVPVIAAGGIADADGVAAALALGAAGVQVGTAFLLCPEATTRPAHRAALRSDAARHTALTNVFSGRPARGIVNRLVRERGPISNAAPAYPLASAAVAPLWTAAEARGSGDFTALWAGQNVSGCREVGAAELTRSLASRL